MIHDFSITDHGTVWTIHAVTRDALMFADENFDVPDWAGVPTHFTTDWRPARDICERLVNDGFNVEIRTR
jgi:hypothetical protein